MITHPALLFLCLLLFVGGLWKASASPTLGRLFRILPVPLWCYLLPMAAASLGWLPHQSLLYDLFSKQLLPVCLVLLLIGVDLKSLARLGPLAIGLMLIGSAGTLIGGFVSYRLYKPWLPPEAWTGFGALIGSWIGGSANLVVVKEALNAPDSLMAPIIIVDALIAYSWMGLLVWSSSFQKLFGGVSPLFGGTGGKTSEHEQLRNHPSPHNLRRTFLLASGVTLSLFVSGAAQWLAGRLPTFGQILPPITWTILLVTTAALVCSLTPLARVEEAGASRAGTFLLYLLLASIGGRASLSAITGAPIFLAVGITWVLCHGIVLLSAGFLLGAPLGLLATASQANIGGPVSASIVGATYHPRLAAAGVLMAVLGNILGTHLGLLGALALRRFF